MLPVVVLLQALRRFLREERGSWHEVARALRQRRSLSCFMLSSAALWITLETWSPDTDNRAPSRLRPTAGDVLPEPAQRTAATQAPETAAHVSPPRDLDGTLNDAATGMAIPEAAGPVFGPTVEQFENDAESGGIAQAGWQWLPDHLEMMDNPFDAEMCRDDDPVWGDGEAAQSFLPRNTERLTK